MFVVLASACTGREAGGHVHAPSTTTPPIETVDPRERLLALGDAWLQTRADVTYRTVGRVLGQPVTAHLCLRQMFDGDANRTELLRTCSRRGRLVLTWHPPKRWRMDVTTPVDRFEVSSATGHSQICRRRSMDLVICRLLSENAAIRASGFEFLFEAPERILDDVGADDVTTTEPSEALESAPVECFAATGPEIHVEWCFSPDGMLLSFLRGSGSIGWESIEATSAA